MARDRDEERGTRTARATANAGHPASGGHARSAKTTARAKNQVFADPRGPQAPTGGDGPYDPVEYPKHVIVDGVLHVCVDAAHEARVTGQEKD